MGRGTNSRISHANMADFIVHADGYFTSRPTDATILLRRAANGQPGGVLYRFGQGWVFATTMYDDWGVANGQYANDLRVTVAFVGWTPTILIGADFTEETKRALAGT